MNSHLVEICVAQDRELRLDWLQKPNSDIETVVGTVSEFGRVLDGSEGTTGLRANVVGTSRVPSAHTTHEKNVKTTIYKAIVVRNSDLTPTTERTPNGALEERISSQR